MAKNASSASTGLLAAIRDRRLRLVTAGLGFAVVTIVVVLLLRSIPEPFEVASDVGDVTLDLGIAYVAGWILFYLTGWRPRAVD